MEENNSSNESDVDIQNEDEMHLVTTTGAHAVYMCYFSDNTCEGSVADGPPLRSLGYKPTLHRTWKFFENFAASFGALYFVGGIRVTFSYGLYGGGPLAFWINYIVTCVFTFITAAMLAEICSALPAAGSIYYWAAQSAGPRWGRLAGFVVAWWSVTAWTSFVAVNSQAAANYLLSELTVFQVDFDGGIDYSNFKFRALAWILSEVMLVLAVLLNYIPPRAYKWLLRVTFFMIVLDFLLNLIWLPIGVYQTYGFQSSDYLLTTYNGTGASPGWNWCLGYLATAGVLVGFDAAGHVAEETQNASQAAARGLFWSAVVSGLFGFPILILFLFCTPNIDTLSQLDAPQPFVSLYAMALGSRGHNTAVAIVAASRLIYAIARDGVLPGSNWIGIVGRDGFPRNAVTFVAVVSGILLLTILPSQVAFSSLVSAAGVPTLTAYGLIAICRLIFTPNRFSNGRWSMSPIFSLSACVLSVLWNSFSTAVLLSPFEFPVDSQNFNYAPLIFGFVTVMAVVSYAVTSEDKWNPLQRRSEEPVEAVHIQS
ncbi:putative amino acid permease [Planoprotostelium fungivorum]|uniref:Putative amino acid permease n=1 Tax=Planoprotostelium fungivorum TaxID=1890364 RepID=A0A2P6NFL0_9EUKA|nr:putative amino acid permease [Planoprotostelium fungivorum]